MPLVTEVVSVVVPDMKDPSLDSAPGKSEPVEADGEARSAQRGLHWD
jgi:hypothetical protein